MGYREQFLTELDLELPFLRRHLERVPENKFTWKPHEKSMPLGNLAMFLAVIWEWGKICAVQDKFDVAQVMAQGPVQPPKTVKELLATFDTKTKEMRAAIDSVRDDAKWEQPWTLLMQGKPVFTQPRWLVMRTMTINHGVHHRAQLGVYLRLNGIAVPAVYNDSADEKGGIFS